MIAQLCHASEHEDTNFCGWNYEANSSLREKLKEILKKQGVEMENSKFDKQQNIEKLEEEKRAILARKNQKIPGRCPCLT